MFWQYVEGIQLHISVESPLPSSGNMGLGKFLESLHIKSKDFYIQHYISHQHITLEIPLGISYFLCEMLNVFGCCLIVLVFNTVLVHRLELIMHPRLALNFEFSCLRLSSRDLQAWDRYHISLHLSILNTTCELQIHSVKFFSYRDMVKLELTQFTVCFDGS